MDKDKQRKKSFVTPIINPSSNELAFFNLQIKPSYQYNPSTRQKQPSDSLNKKHSI